MIHTRTLIVAAAVVSAAGLARAQVDEAAKQKLEEMAKAVRDAQAISYRVHFYGKEGMMAIMPPTKIEVTQKRDPNKPGSVWLTRVEGRRDEVQGVPAVEILLVSDGEKRTWIDNEKKTVFERPLTQNSNDVVVISANLAVLRELLEAEPFTKDLAAPTIRSEAGTTVNGVECDVVVADQGPELHATTWVIAKTDRLPRRVERKFAGGVGSQIWELTEVQLNPSVELDRFELPIPEGFSKNSTVAPRPISEMNPAAAPRAPKPAAPQKEGQGARVPGVNTGNLAPDFELPAPDGQKVTLSSLRGNVVVLDFWGTWCLPCKKASPELQRLADDFKSHPVKVYGLAVREQSDDKPIAYMADNKYTYGLLLRADDVAKQYKVKVFPTYFVIGREGEIVHIATGYDPDTTFPEIRAAIQRALGSATAKQAKPAEPAPADGGDAAADK